MVGLEDLEAVDSGYEVKDAKVARGCDGGGGSGGQNVAAGGSGVVDTAGGKTHEMACGGEGTGSVPPGPTEAANEPTSGAAASGDVFHPVHCAECDTEVGVMGAADEVVHFFNVLASHA